MRRIAIRAAVIGGVVLAARALGPRLHARLLVACEGMFEQMSADFPPKKMMAGIEEIRTTTTRTLELLQERTQTERSRPQEPLWTPPEELEVVHP